MSNSSSQQIPMSISGSTDAAGRGATDGMSISISTDAADDRGATTGGNTDLATALSKLTTGNFNRASLPKSREASDIWGRIEVRYNLTLGEISALQNETCSRPRGVLQRVDDSTMYTIQDERIRASFTISNDRYTLLADLLVDSGASTELKLPARKVLQLGLQRRHGPRTHTRGSTNHTIEMLIFSTVLVKAVFTRDGVEESVEADLAVKCEKDEYEELERLVASGVADLSSPAAKQGGDLFTTPKGQEPNEANSNAHAVNNSNPIRVIRLSPVHHRPRHAPLQQAVIGMNGLKKLGLHVNCDLQQLEIEEDEVVEDCESL